MNKLESVVASLKSQSVKTSFQNSSSSSANSNLIACPNGIEIQIEKPEACNCCRKPINVFNIRDSHYPVDRKSSIFHRVIYCSHSDTYNQDIYIIFNYLLGAKLHYLKPNNDLSKPIASFAVPISEAITFNITKLLSELKRKFEFNE